MKELSSGDKILTLPDFKFKGLFKLFFAYY